MSGPGNTQTHSQHSIRQYWVKRSEPLGWWPGGLLPLLAWLLLALVALLWFAPACVEREVEQSAKERLDRLGLEWAEVNADGQALLITGTAPAEIKEEAVAALAGVTECATALGGELRCPTDVEVRLKRAKPTPAPAVVAQRHHDFEFVSDGTKVTLRGEVPSNEAKQWTLKAARKNYAQVVDELRVSKDRATNDRPSAVAKAIALLPQLESGRAAWKSGKFSLSGWVSAAKQPAVRSEFAANPKSPPQGALTLQIKEKADACDKQFAEVLAKSTIRFATGSALIRTGSMTVINQLAEVAKRCPGSIRIEGHTDNVGKNDSNEALSQKRADSVKASLQNLGVEPERLEPRGFGPRRPRAPNTTAAGRAANRRIEVRIVR